MSDQSDTPLCDANQDEAQNIVVNSQRMERRGEECETTVVPLSVARNIERKLAEAKRQLVEQTASHAVTVGHCHDAIESLSRWRDMARKLAEHCRHDPFCDFFEDVRLCNCKLAETLAEFNALNETKS